MNRSEQKTIADFGQQWTMYQSNAGFYGSLALFEQIVGPLIDIAEIRGLRVADIGAGTGRISSMLCDAGAAEVTAVEPSRAYDVLRKNIAHYGDRVTCYQVPGSRIPDRQYDLVVSIGVLHHIPDPAATMRAAFQSLRPGGRMLAWLYGREGNELYLSLLTPLRGVTKRLPHQLNAALSWILDVPLAGYIAACRFVPLPLHDYVRNTLSKLTADKRRLTIYDQINPEWAEYYTYERAQRLFADAGFVDIRMHHRGGYSWSIIGTKPAMIEHGK